MVWRWWSTALRRCSSLQTKAFLRAFGGVVAANSSALTQLGGVLGAGAGLVDEDDLICSATALSCSPVSLLDVFWQVF